MNEPIQLYGELLPLPLQAQASDVGNYDTEAELRCPNCECAIPVAETCVYCSYDLIQWAISLQQANALSETLEEMRLENVNYQNGGKKK